MVKCATMAPPRLPVLLVKTPKASPMPSADTVHGTNRRPGPMCRSANSPACGSIPSHGNSAPRNSSSSPIALAAARMKMSRVASGPSRSWKLRCSPCAQVNRTTATRVSPTNPSPSSSPAAGERRSHRASRSSTSRYRSGSPRPEASISAPMAMAP
jgi:hypothetical protein